MLVAFEKNSPFLDRNGEIGVKVRQVIGISVYFVLILSFSIPPLEREILSQNVQVCVS